MILGVTNAILPEPGPASLDVAARVAAQTLATRGEAYANEVRRLLDAALEAMRRCGTTSRPRVADIVAAAGLSNEAFYRHFPSKDALVAALLDDGAGRLRSYLEYQMAKARGPEQQVRRWIEGVLAQSDDDIAATTRAVLWNGGSAGPESSGRHFASASVGALLRGPLAELGSTDPELDASLVAHAVFGLLTDALWQESQPSRAEIDHLVAFALAAVSRRT
jgi:AcrR family transcriptional regulator